MASSTPAVVAPSSIGFVDQLSEPSANNAQVKVIGWALSKDGIAHVELVLNGRTRIALHYGVPRPDVAQAYPSFPDSAAAGFDASIDAAKWPVGIYH